MKEIKYRGWNTEAQRMFSWEEIFSNPIYLKSFFGNEYFCTNPPKYCWKRMQYTGLKDKNGKEIYENDIVYYEAGGYAYPGQGISVVTWNLWDDGEYAACEVWVIKKPETEDFYYPLFSCFSDKLEILGNIYENPELLEKKE